jgi:N-acetylglucosaminyl-diphospho-decaprenol L-rhamnosyltransferase
MLEQNPDISIVIIVFDTDPRLLEDCLLSAHRARSSSSYVVEMIVIDNSPHEALRSRFSDRVDRWLHGQGNIGFAKAANLGTDVARGRRLLFLNPDAVLESSALEALELAADSTDGDSVFCGWLSQDGLVQVDAYLHWWTSIGRLLRRSAYRRYLEMNVDAPLVAVQKVSGGAMYADRSMLERLGPYDERFFLYGEDADLSVRARKAGLSLWAVPAASIPHVAASSQMRYSTLVERARADATIRISRYHLPLLASIAVQIDLLFITILAVALGKKGSSNSVRARRARLGEIWRWGMKRDRTPFVP